MPYFQTKMLPSLGEIKTIQLSLAYPLSWAPKMSPTKKLSCVLTTAYSDSGVLSGIACDKYGNTITGIVCDVRVFDRTTFQLIGQTQSSIVNGQWSLNNSADKGLKVLVVFSYEGTYLGDTDIAGAEYLTYV